MAKKDVNKKPAPKKVTKPQTFKRPNINLLVTMTVLVLSLFFVLYQANQSQNIRTRAAGDCSVTSVQLQTSSLEQDMFNRINTYRTSKGLSPLTWEQSLNQAASWMTRDMITRGSVQKIDSLGRGLDMRFQDCGVKNTNNYNEIIINGAAAADEVLYGLQIDAPDNAILLNATYVTGAVSVETDASGESAYWTLTFAGNPINSLSPTLGGGTGPSNIPVVTEYVPSPACLGAVCPTGVPTQAPDNYPVTPTDSLTPTVRLTQGPTPTDVPGGDGPGNGGGTPSAAPGLSGTVDPNNPNPGGGTVTTTPGVGDPNNPDDPNNGGLPPINGEGGFIGFFLALLALLLRFFLSMFGR